MPTFLNRVPDYKGARDVAFEWDTFRKGLNTLLRENEIGKDELAQANNLLLKGRGVPTKRWGLKQYYTAGTTGAVRGLKGFYKSDGTNELLAITDDGYLTKKNGSSFTVLNGVSFASGNDASMAQLYNTMYIVNSQRELVKYSSPTLVGFATLNVPIILSATNLSNATGTTTKSYRLSAVSNQGGETLGSTSFELPAQPAVLGGIAGGVIRLSFTGVSLASILEGFNIYGRDQGDWRFLAGIPATSTTYDDNGTAIPKEFTFPPTADSTGGPKAGIVKRFQDRLIYGKFPNDPSKILISGRAPNHEKYDLANGGNYIYIEQDAGDDIVTIETFADRIIVFKQKSVWQITLTSEAIGNFFVTTPNLRLITASYGCIAPKSVVAVENDTYFLSKDGVYTLGYQQNYAVDQLRANGISVKIRPFFDNLTVSQKMGASATYHKKKYIIQFSGLDQQMVFDTERAAWTGPMNIDGNVFEVYKDSDSNEHLLIGRDDGPTVDEYAENYTDDNGVAIETSMRTRQENFGDWSTFKNMKNLFFQFRNITGQANIDIRLERRSGLVVTAESLNITANTGNSGWGADMWGSTMWGNSNVAGSAGTDSQQLIRWRKLNKLARSIQISIRTTEINDNYELLGIRGDAKPIGRAFLPSSWKE